MIITDIATKQLTGDLISMIHVLSSVSSLIVLNELSSLANTVCVTSAEAARGFFNKMAPGHQVSLLWLL